MPKTSSPRPRSLLLFVFSLFLAGCETAEQSIALGISAIAGYGARTPSHEVEQVYYLGTFDPQDQVPPTIYRVRVHGQASAISGTNFSSGWVPAPVVDTLTTDSPFGDKSDKVLEQARTLGEQKLAKIESRRRMVQFGPEGMREAPEDHRLVIVMGSSPQSFFEGVNTALSNVSRIEREQSDSTLKSKLFEDLLVLRAHRQRLRDLETDVATDITLYGGQK